MWRAPKFLPPWFASSFAPLCGYDKPVSWGRAVMSDERIVASFVMGVVVLGGTAASARATCEVHGSVRDKVSRGPVQQAVVSFVPLEIDVGTWEHGSAVGGPHVVLADGLGVWRAQLPAAGAYAVAVTAPE